MKKKKNISLWWWGPSRLEGCRPKKVWEQMIYCLTLTRSLRTTHVFSKHTVLIHVYRPLKWGVTLNSHLRQFKLLSLFFFVFNKVHPPVFVLMNTFSVFAYVISLLLLLPFFLFSGALWVNKNSQLNDGEKWNPIALYKPKLSYTIGIITKDNLIG